ncbi:type 1 glutamine amidotransferase domain-containing protein [Arthrobacter methylotrophus]|uniref:Type 1 glutamine amidotransferase domain-containing protein n=1 Tax=Arthrobacter methylotrophus TaxID=121291 RepID=A0ABV5UQ98_9MICC
MSLENIHVVIVTADFFEESEVIYPLYRLREAGATVTLAGPQGGPLAGKSGLRSLAADKSFEELEAGSFDAVLIPGGFAPDIVRRSEPVLRFLCSMNASGKPIGMICHGGWVGISAGIVAGRSLTSVPSIRIDLENAGATWIDQGVVEDGSLVTARVPDDMGAWMKAFVGLLERTTGK